MFFKNVARVEDLMNVTIFAVFYTLSSMSIHSNIFIKLPRTYLLSKRLDVIRMYPIEKYLYILALHDIFL